MCGLALRASKDLSADDDARDRTGTKGFHAL